ncbi:MAG: IS66 family transposase, partial [Paramuribaculum sp.]|nr:IS66 family transposase [Paramuribaculum sp.]
SSDRLEMVVPKLYVERIVRHKVIAIEDMDKNPEERTIIVSPLPQSPIDHDIAGASVLAEIILGKFLYHLPFYRQINRFREFGLRLPASTVGDWYEKSVESLNVLYKLLRKQVMASEYIQVDESVVPVLDNEKHKARKGYEWCVRDGLTGSLFFWYDRGSRSGKTAKELLGGYRGTFQSDGYETYDQFFGVNGVTGAACWAHARGKFVDALKENQKLATQAIVMIGKLYEVESKADEAGMDHAQRKKLRQKEAYPVIQLMEKWCVDTYSTVPKSSLTGKAIAYTYSLMDQLAVYVNDGRINIDNNLIENSIRPLALGHKNWLFCSDDASAYRAAIVYSMLVTCRSANIDPRQWLEHVLVEIPARKKTGVSMDDLLPMAYAKQSGVKAWNLPDPD